MGRFLDELTCYDETEKKLEHSICVALSSTECIEVTRVMSIVKFAIRDQLRFLAACTHEFSHLGWSAMHMSKQCYIVESVLDEMLDASILFVSKEFMMNVFSESKAKLPLFRDF